MKSYIKVPMIAAIILEALILFISLIMYLNQDKILKNLSGMFQQTEKVIPTTLFLYIIMLIVYIIFFLVMASYDGNSYRGVGTVMVVVWCMFNIVSPYLSNIQTRITSIKGNDAMAAVSMLTSQISLFVTPLSVIASALALLAVGRFSVENEYREAAPMGIIPAAFGQGYTPMQGYTPVQGYTPAQGPVPGQNDQQGQ